jgi:ATP-dependent DNA helicase RecG
MSRGLGVTATAEAFMTAENNNESELLTMFLERVVGAARGSEALDFEVKSAKGGLPKSLWETVSAFANTHGGWLLLGVRQEGQSLVIEGLPNAGSLLDDFFATLRNPSKINHSVCGVRDVGIEDINGKNIIAIRVPEAPRQQRPIHINDNPYTGTFVRRHTGDYRCTKAEVNRMIREASDVGADKTVLSDFTLHDIDQDALMRYRQLYQNRNIADPRNTYDTLRFLKSINAYGEERNSDKEGLTVAGLLLFGTEKAIRQWRGRHLIDFRIVSSEDKDQRWEDRVVWEGNLLSAFEAIYPRLIAGLATEFRLEGILRVDEGSVQTVLREAFVNLLVHTDYTIQEASLILRSGDGFRFRNPGNSRVSELDLFHGDRSDPRNPELVRMFRYIGLAEEAGTGIPKIIRAWRELGLEMPRIDVGTERYEFTLHLRQVHLISRQDRQWLRSLNEFWSEPEQFIMNTLQWLVEAGIPSINLVRAQCLDLF